MLILQLWAVILILQLKKIYLLGLRLPNWASNDFKVQGWSSWSFFTLHLSFPDFGAKKVIKNSTLHWIDAGATHVKKKNNNERKQKQLQELEQEEKQGKKEMKELEELKNQDRMLNLNELNGTLEKCWLLVL